MKRTIKRTLAVLLAMLFVMSAFSTGSGTLAADEGYQNGDVIEFGSYPQTCVTDEGTLAALSAMDKRWSSLDVFAKRSESVSTQGYSMEIKDIMQYADVDLNGEKYRAVRFSAYRPAFSNQFETVLTTLSSNYQFLNGYLINTVYWFKWEPIRWYVLDAESGLVFCEKIMDTLAFNPQYYMDPGSRIWYRDTDCTVYASNYEHSYIREWLTDRTHENGFFNAAFTDWQASLITYSNVDNHPVFASEAAYPCADTQDQLFFFSTSELIGAGDLWNRSDSPNRKWSISTEQRNAAASDYAMCLGLPTQSPYGSKSRAQLGGWFTRSVSSTTSKFGPEVKVYCCDDSETSCQIHGIYGVRPAMRLDPEKLKSGMLTQPQTVTSGTCGETVCWTFDEKSGVLSLNGTGAMDSLDTFGDYGYSARKDDIQFVAVADGITSVGAHAFEGCPILEEVILGEDVTTVGEAAFVDCPRLMNVTLLSDTISADGAFPNDRMDWMLIFPENNTQALALAKRIGIAYVPVSYENDVLSFGGTITVHDGYAYSYLPMFVQRYGSAQKVYFNRLVFADVPTQSVEYQTYTGDYFGCLTMHYVEVTIVYVSPDGEQGEVTYDRMIELLQSGDYRAFKLRVSTPTGGGEEKTQEETIYEKLEEILPFMPRKVLRLVSKAINFIVSIFKKK